MTLENKAKLTWKQVRYVGGEPARWLAEPFIAMNLRKSLNLNYVRNSIFFKNSDQLTVIL